VIGLAFFLSAARFEASILRKDEPMSVLQAILPGALQGGRESSVPLALDSATLTALVEGHASMLYRVAYSVVRNAEDAEDVVQETFVRVLKHSAKFSEIRDPRVWLVRIAWNLALDRKRRAKYVSIEDDATALAQQMPSKDLPADAMAIGAEGHARVLAMLEKLPAKEREVLMLSAFDELNTTEIAAVLDTTESTVRSRLFRARQIMRKKLTAAEAKSRSARGE
jgi:RNA polymerase sigma-70 factor (ECF subfamily)